MIIIHSFKSLPETFEARASEWMFGFATFSLSLVFFLNDNLIDHPCFEGMRNIHEHQRDWALLLLIVGLGRLIVLFINGSYWRTPHFRALAAFLSSGIWCLMCFGFLDQKSLMIAIMPWIFLLDTYNIKRASREAGNSEFVQRYIMKKKQEQVSAGIANHPNV